MNRTKFILIVLLLAFINLAALPGFISHAASTVEYSKVFGGSGLDQGNSIAVDADGNTVVVGASQSSNLLVTPGAVNMGAGGFNDLFVLKVNPAGEVLFAARLGGSSFDEARAVALDASGNIYITGQTTSVDFPTTPGAFREQSDNPPPIGYTVFAAKLSAAGDRLLYSTFIGAGEADGLAVDATGNAYITGASGFGNYPTTPGAIRITPAGKDAFVTKLNPSGSALVYSTLLGGSKPDQGHSIAVDAAGNIYVTGRTDSPDFPTTQGAFQRTYASPTTPDYAPGYEGDVFIAKLNPANSTLLYSTFLGGNDYDEAVGLAIDAAGAAYVVGVTDSTNFPTTASAFQRRGTAFGDTFIAKLNPAGSALGYATLLGGGGNDIGYGIAIDSAGNATVTGYTDSSDFPTVNAVQPNNQSGPIFKSTDSGNTWNAVNAGLGSATIIYTLAVDAQDSSTLYSGGDGGFKSTNGGTDWHKLAYPAPYGDSITRTVTIEPANPATLYAVSHQGRVVKSQDGGASWRDLGLVATDYALVIDPTNSATLYAATDAPFQGTGVSRSTDGGATWRFTLLSSFRHPVRGIALDPQRPATLYAIIDSGGVVKSTDSGTTWTSTGLQEPSIISLAVDPLNPMTMYAGANSNQIFKSTDGGNSWASSRLGASVGSVNALAIDRTNSLKVYAGTSDGVFKSTDGGSNWMATALRRMGVSAVAIDPNQPATLYAGTAHGTNAFVAKLNTAGSAIFYSTYFGGGGYDTARAVALDATGNTYVTGTAGSANFPTINAPASPNGIGGVFIVKFTPSQETAAPRILTVTTSGKNLVVTGENFTDGAVLLLDGEAQRTLQDEQTARTVLIGKKTAKRIAHGQTVTIQVKNSDGGLSEPFRFTRN
jgi:BNR/Asp-box repeat./Beta-propeller repeat.